MQALQPYKPKPYYRPKHIKHEENLQKQVCNYLRMRYPNVIFRSDYASGLKLTMNQAVQHKRLQSSRSFPDLFVYEPREVVRKDGAEKFYSGLALELKKEGTRIYLTTGPRKGKLSSDVHIQEQALMLQELNRRGYVACFAVGFNKAQQIIDWYMGASTENAELF